MDKHKFEDSTTNDVDQTRYPMPDWAVRQVVRTSGLVENVCKHGVGHPHPASVKEFEDRGILSMGVHGCDGCCWDDETKQRSREQIEIELSKMKNMDGEYLIVGTYPTRSGYAEARQLTERKYLVHNILNFMSNNPKVGIDDIVIYELRGINVTNLVQEEGD